MRTIAELWQAAVGEERPYPAFLYESAGVWNELGWPEAAARIDELAAGFLSLGIVRGDRVSILSRTRLEWTLCDFALISLGALVVPIYPTSSTLDCLHVLRDSGARAVVCEDAAQRERIESRRAEAPSLEHLVAIEETAGTGLALTELTARGRAYLEQHPAAVANARAAISETDVATIVYTSGTTGPPKGCVLEHRQLWTMVDMVRQIRLLEPGDSILLYLPLAHTIARLVELVATGVGATLAFCPDTGALPNALAAVRPTILPSVPRVFEKVHAGVQASFAELTGPKRRLVEWALAVGYRASRLRREGHPCPPALALELRIADRLVFSKVKARLGGRVRLALSGGAPLAPEIAEFFHALGLLVLEGYGLTEATTATHLNRPDAYRFGTVGPPLPGVEARLAGDGEVLVRSETLFAGYWGDEEATRDVLPGDGWLRTGDIGTIAEDGFLTITDRKKELIVTAGGKNVAPQNIENALRASSCISHALVVGDRRPYLGALITLTPEAASAADNGEDVAAAVERAVADVNAKLGRVEQVKRFTILTRDFAQEEDEITPTLKLKRRVCESHFREEIEALYR